MFNLYLIALALDGVVFGIGLSYRREGLMLYAACLMAVVALLLNRHNLKH